MLGRLKGKRHHILLFLILSLTTVLTCWRIWAEGNGNVYYTAAVSSMLQSWHTFFYASFDPAGFISVDKPALGLWLQCASALVFGVHGWSVILPEALCAVASVWVLYRIVSRGFGPAAGLASALALALTPIFIAVSRTNELDSSLVLVMLLAAWAVLSAAERGSLGLLILSMALIGVGFNIKMLQAYMVLPALLAVYAFTAKVKPGKRALHLAAAVAVLLAVSLSWAVAVDLTPADSRPYVGSSSTNSVLELALGYNGIKRVLPRGTGKMGQGGKPGGMDVGVGMNEGGEAGVLRLFNQNMAGQASWLIPLALFGILALALNLRRDGTKEQETRLRHLVLWTGWSVPMMAYFSISGFFHRYYMCVLAPGLAALAGVGAAELWKLYKQGGWRALPLPAAIAATAAVQCVILSRYQEWGSVLIPVLVAVDGVAVAALLLWPWMRRLEWLKPAAAAAGLLALLAAPAAWSCTPLLYGSQTSLPVAGPELNKSGGMMPGEGVPGRGFRQGPGGQPGQTSQLGQSNQPGKGGNSSQLIAFLLKNNTGEKYLAAVPDASTAAPIILSTGKAVMAVGGFLGSDPALTVAKLEKLVHNGELKYFMLGGRENQMSEVANWVRQHGKEVSADQWGRSVSTGRGGPDGGMLTLYELTG